jgi:hypothetical protein
VAGKYSANRIHSLIYSPRYGSKTMAKEQTLLGHVMRYALIIYWRTGKWQTSSKASIRNMEFVTRLSQLWRVGEWSNKPSNTQRQPSLRLRVETECKRCSPCRGALHHKSRIVLPASSPTLRCIFAPQMQAKLRRAAAELMHLTKHYLATGISAFAPENLW